MGFPTDINNSSRHNLSGTRVMQIHAGSRGFINGTRVYKWHPYTIAIGHMGICAWQAYKKPALSKSAQGGLKFLCNPWYHLNWKLVHFKSTQFPL